MCAAIVIGGLASGASAQQPRDGWTDLLAGGTTEQWTTLGDPAAWAVEGGELKVVKPGQGWWLRTKKMYRDFELELDFSVPEDGNSGVGLRGSSYGDPAFTGLEVQIFENFGDPVDVNVCGAVYNAIAPSTQACKPAGEWNKYRIRLVGDTLDVWLNGTHVQDAQKLDERGYFRQPEQKTPLRDRLTTGYISLQDHGDAVRFRNIRVKDLSSDPDPGDFTPACNGRDLTGWTARGGGEWSVEDGTIVGRNGPGHLFCDAEHGDIEFRAFVKVNARGNSGMYFRTVPRPEDPNTWPLGYEAQVDNHDPKNFTGSIYDKAWPQAKSPITRDDAWFDYRVRAVGSHVETWINGVPMVNATLDEFSRGHMALQTHHNGNVIMYKDIQVRTPSGKK
jgi:hypothetical protein